MTTNNDNILYWLDLETTGLERDADCILELGFVTTDKELNYRTRKNWVFPFAGDVSPFIAEMHGKNGLLAECRTEFAASLEVPCDPWLDIYHHILGHVRDTKPRLCGSGVSFDRGFLKRYAPQILELFHYRSIDVSVLRETIRYYRPEWVAEKPEAQKQHRALPDLDDTIIEFRHYKTRLFA